MVSGDTDPVLPGRIVSEQLQQPTLLDSFRRIQPQEPSGNSSNACNRPDERTIQLEVLGPNIPAWVKEPDHLAGRWIEGGDIRALVSITDDAGVCQVVPNRSAFMLLADDVVNLVIVTRILFADTAVLATVIGTIGYLPA